MTLRWGTGFDLMRTQTDGTAQFAQLGWYGLPGGFLAADMTIQTSNTPFGYGKALLFDNTNVSEGQTQASYLLRANDDTVLEKFTWYQGSRVYVTSNNIQTRPFMGVGRTGDAFILAAFREFGQIELWKTRPNRDPSPTLLATSDPGSYTNDTWIYFEIGGFLSDMADGWVKVRINTVEVIDVIAEVTQDDGLALNSFMLGYLDDDVTGQGGARATWDDMYFCDSDGMENNDFLGNIRVQGLIPNAAGDSTTWTPFGAMTNWEAATNDEIDDDEYVYSPNIGDYDLYNITPLVNTPTVFGVQVTGYYKQDDATQRSVANRIKSGTTEVDGEEFFTSSDYTASTDMWEEDPDTNDPWLYADVNNLQIGPKVIS